LDLAGKVDTQKLAPTGGHDRQQLEKIEKEEDYWDKWLDLCLSLYHSSESYVSDSGETLFKSMSALLVRACIEH
jgi:hypothetical protein